METVKLMPNGKRILLVCYDPKANISFFRELTEFEYKMTEADILRRIKYRMKKWS